MNVHKFLLNSQNDLSNIARELPKIREYMDSLPKTATTFRVSSLPVEETHRISNKHMEMLGSWVVPDIYTSSSKEGRLFVNPHAEHARSYSDIIIECRCGTRFARSYTDGYNVLRDENNHENCCKTWWRLESRTELARKRDDVIREMARLGNRGADIAPRLGVTRNSVGQIANRNQYTLEELYDDFRRLAGNTYAHLVRRKGVSVEEVCDIYGVAKPTLTRWRRNFGTWDDDNFVFERDDGGKYTWKKEPKDKRPEWMRGESDD